MHALIQSQRRKAGQRSFRDDPQAYRPGGLCRAFVRRVSGNRIARPPAALEPAGLRSRKARLCRGPDAPEAGAGPDAALGRGRSAGRGGGKEGVGTERTRWVVCDETKRRKQQKEM